MCLYEGATEVDRNAQPRDGSTNGKLAQSMSHVKSTKEGANTPELRMTTYQYYRIREC
jgi:hypothetical protein